MKSEIVQGNCFFQSPFYEQGKRFPEKNLFTFHQEHAAPNILTGRDLNRNVNILGSTLKQIAAPRGRALLLLPQGLDFIYSLIACWFANVIAVPIPVTDFSDEEKAVQRIIPILKDARATCILTDASFLSRLKSNPEFQSLTLLNVQEVVGQEAAGATFKEAYARPHALKDIALLLYTSGSTSQPKGVMLSHGNLIAQARMAAGQWEIDGDSRIVSWAPLFHSFGLIVGLLAPLVEGAASVILPPGGFVKNPQNWFNCLDRYQATHTGAPNFALELCCNSIAPEAVADLSVHALKAIVCGGEPIRKATWESFVRKFGHIGFKKTKFCPNYGLSETGGLASKKTGRSPLFLALDKAALEKGKIVLCDQEDKSKLVTSCGEIGAGITALSVNPASCAPCAVDEIGEIWIKSPSVAQGYLNLKAETRRAFAGTLSHSGETGFFRTGDLGFIRDNHLFIIGREKEVIIISGKNYHPADIEWTIKTHVPDLNLPVAVFAHEIADRERVIVVQEIAHSLEESAYRNAIHHILGSVSQAHGLDVYEINLVRKNSIPRSDSGKIQRRMCKSAYLNQALTILHGYRQGQPWSGDESRHSFSSVDGPATRLPPAMPAQAGIQEHSGSQDSQRPGDDAGGGNRAPCRPIEVIATLKSKAFLPELSIAPDWLENVEHFNALGLSSIQYTRIAKRIEDVFNIPFTPVLFFKYQSFELLGRHIAAQDQGQRPAERPADIAMSGTGAGAGDIAIIGLSCHFPGGARDADLFWENIVQGKDAITTLAASRPRILADAQRYGAALADGFPQWGGFIEDADTFDAAFFAVSPLEAESMDPQQRKLLELTWEVIERSGYNPRRLAGQPIGVFVGAHNCDYAELVNRHPSLVNLYGAFLDSGLHMSIMPHRVSRWFDFRGPSELINTACSSSLVAVHHAADAIRSGESTMAIACGINLIFTPRLYLTAHQAGMLAADGRCKTFDQQADGFARAEGYGAVLLKPLRRAIADHDTIYGVIKGTVINHDGRSNSLRAPNLEGQKQLMLAAWRKSGVSPATIGYIETHGTGTSLGDPIEIQALQEAFQEIAPPPVEAFCGLGSVKSLIGHTESASGIAGLIKVLMAMRHQTLPGALHLKALNPLIQLGGGPFFIPRQSCAWQRLKTPDGNEIPRRAGISSFGVGGANAHVIVEEFLPPTPIDACPADQEAQSVVVLSAHNRDRLLAYAGELHTHLKRCGARIKLPELAYTLQVGRQAMAARVVFRVRDLSELSRQLEAFVQCQGHVDDCLAGGCRPGRSPAEAAPDGVQAVARRWLQGETIDWELFWAAPKPRRIELPAYPFARESCWFAAPEETPAAACPPRLYQREHPEHGASGATFLLTPVWDPVVWPENAPVSVGPSEIPVVVGGTRAQKDAIALIYPDARFLDIDGTAAIADISAQFQTLGAAVAHIVWIAPDSPLESLTDERLIADQDAGLMQLFRMVKALLALDYGCQKLKWTLITTQTQAVGKADVVRPTHAGVHGFSGALAKEQPDWQVRAIDVTADCAWPVRELLTRPFCLQGDAFALRGDEWFRQTLIPLREVPDGAPVYRQNGVYVVIGGAGGLGQVWTRYLEERYQAQVIWIGRRSSDALARPGDQARYMQADARDEAALQKAYAGIKQRHAVIHGVIHAAVGLFDQSIADMPEARFRDVCSAKIDLSVRIGRVFQKEPLDFLLFFSSIAAFERNGGMSGYAAGCAFADAYAGALASCWPCTVKVMNWGYWRLGTGDKIPDAFKRRIQQSGMQAIEPEEGMAALETLLGGPMAQLAFVKTRTPTALPLLNANEWIAVQAQTMPSMMQLLQQPFQDLAERVGRRAKPRPVVGAQMEALLLRLLGGTLRAMGVWVAPDAPLPERHRQWLAQSKRFLRQANFLRRDGEKEVLAAPCPGLARLWEEWDQARRGWLAEPGLKAHVLLAEACLRALPDILSGRQKPTEVLFPQASMDLAAGIFKGNGVADFFNDVLSDALAAAVQERLRQDPGAQVRILEIGAGTGGTTAAILPKLRSFEEQIAEYCYTDLSQAFLLHGQAQYSQGRPYLRTCLFDVEAPLAAQDLPAGRYDLIVAANVLHATRNIRRTLRNAKALLRKHGWLLLNELSEVSLHAHLTFGLLDGWWLTEDAALRIPGSPGLYPAAWQRLLAEEGFEGLAFPAASAHGLGQQIILAQSDGIVRQARVSRPAPAVCAEPQPGVPAASCPYHDGMDSQAEELRTKSIAYFTELVAKTLRMQPHLIASAAPLESYGIDSILIAQITKSLRENFAGVDSTLLYEIHTIDELVTYFVRHQADALTRLVGLADRPPGGAEALPGSEMSALDADAQRPAPGLIAMKAPLARSALQAEPIAIIGLSGRYPQAETLAAFWQNLKSGRDCITEIPAERWDWRAYTHEAPDQAATLGKSYSKWGAFLDDCWRFDPLFFNLTPHDAAFIDPQERLFLEEAWKALEDAGYAPSRLSARLRRRTGVFGGVTKQGFNLYARDVAGASAHTSFASLVNRVSYHLNLQGPSLPIDTMCSSALAAIHAACEYLRSGRGDLAIAGGVNLYLHPDNYIELSRGRMIAADRSCRAFAEGGMGFVPGEGVGVVVLKPYHQALADKDPIHALIIGSGLRHDGRTTGYGIPDPQRQAALMRETLQEYGIDPRSIGYIEAAANGSAQGDAIEMAALTQVFGDRRGSRGDYRIGSLKPTIGHAESASGMAQLTKVILSLTRKTLLPTVVDGHWNPEIRFDQLPFRVQQEVAAWQPVRVDGMEMPRRAGITGLGAGGVNAHIVLEEYRPSTLSAPSQTACDAPLQVNPCLFVLSAKSKDRLAAYARRWLDYLERTPDADLARIAYTLQMGREEMAWRLGIVCADAQMLSDGLRAWLDGAENTEVCFCGDADGARREPAGKVAQCLQARDLPAIAKLWTAGNRVAWEALYAEEKPARVSGLPTYPFQRKDCRPQARPRYANRAEAFYTQESKAVGTAFEEEYLTFAPFPEKIPGFSMTRVLLHPERYPDECALVKARQIEMRQVLFCREDFERIQKVFDIGCGYGTDVIQIAALYPHLQAHGYTITRAQADLGRRRIAQRELVDRAAIFCRDSARAPFPDRYDLIIGIEVTFHIRDKQALFGNIAAALDDDGRLLLIDYVANLRGAIVDPELEISIPTPREWAQTLANHDLIIDEVIDVSPQIANFVFDPQSEENIQGLPEPSRGMWRNFAHQATALEKGWITYALFKIGKDGRMSASERLDRNLARLSAPLPYAQALAAMLARGHVPYPRSAPHPRIDAEHASEARRGVDPAPRADALAADGAPAAPEVGGVRARLIRIFGQTLQLDPQDVQGASTFRELGIRSVNAVELLEAINTAFDLDLPTSLLFECNTLDALAHSVAQRRSKRSPAAAPQPANEGGGASLLLAHARTVAAPAKARKAPGRPAAAGIAVIGIACRCAGADGPEELWELVSRGQAYIREIGDPAWLEFFRQHSDRPVPLRYGAMDGRADFDPLFFRISPKEMQSMDIRHGLVLAESYKALEDAGYAPAGLKGRPVGTFIGSMGATPRTHDYSHFSLIGSEASILASRLAYFLDLKGPALAVNTACSSSLVAMHLACQSLDNGEIELAIAGGISIWDHPGDFITMHNAGMLSPTGACRPFDDRADGIVVGDGVGIVILKRLADARRDRDHIYGVIRGSGTNQDGQTAGITVPSFLSQSRLQTAVFRKAGVQAQDLQYIEAHGTATKLGDPIEIHALTESFQQFTDQKRFCAIGSLKANIGHTAAAAGVLSFIKVLLCLTHRQLPPAIHFERRNRHIDFDNSPVYVNTALKPWPENAAGVRLAAVSSFGFSGTNAHMVVESGPAAQAATGLPGQFLVPLSAQTRERLQAVASRLRAFISSAGIGGTPSAMQIDAADLAYTLQVGRDALDERLCLTVTSLPELEEKLAAFLAGRAVAGLHQGNAKADPTLATLVAADPDMARVLDSWAEKHKYAELADLWVRGGAIDWHRLHGDIQPRRISLPTYPFQPESGPHSPLRVNPIDSAAEAAPVFSSGEFATLLFRPLPKAQALKENTAAIDFREHWVMAFDPAPTETPGINWVQLLSDSAAPAQAYEAIALQVFQQIKALLAKTTSGPLLLQILVPPHGPGRLFCGLGGLLKTAHAENPKFYGQIIEIEAAGSPAGLIETIRRERRAAEDAHIRYSKGRRRVYGLEEIGVAASARDAAGAMPWKDRGVYLISGGAGGLGLIFAAEIARATRDAAVMLAGRAPLGTEQAARIRAVADQGVRIAYAQADVSREDAVAALIRDMVHDFGRIDGILHSAGVTRDSFILKKESEAFKAVLAPKVAGTLNLDHATRELDLDFFILFSSGAVLGNPGQADYAAANAFMDAFARYRNQLIIAGKRRGRTLSINWPLWQAGGMRVDPATEAVLRQNTGMAAMDSRTGIQALYRAWAARQHQVMVVSGDAHQIRQYAAAGGSRQGVPGGQAGATDRLHAPQLASEALRAEILRQLKRLVGDALQIAPDRIRLA